MRSLWFFAMMLFAVFCLAACARQNAGAFIATDVTGADFGKDFHLIDHNGVPRSLADFRGKVVVMFFGYTHCPDVCPTTLSDLNVALSKMGSEADRVQVLFITVDPERDTPELLKNYVPAFNPKFLGLYGDARATEAVAKEFKIVYQKEPGTTPSNYSVDHSAGTYALDPHGHLRLFFGYGQTPDVFAHDLRELLRSTPS